jgi:hypothetical protein
VASGQSRTIRLNRPIKLTDVQEAKIQQDVYVQSCFQTWQKQKGQVEARYGTFENGRGSRRYEVAIIRRNWYHLALRAACKTMKEHIRQCFDEEQPIIDVLRQVHGLPPGSGQPMKTQELTPEQAQAFDLLFVMTPSSFEAERKWRAAAVDAMVRVNLGARRRLRALKSNNSKHTRPIGFTPMMNPLTKKIQRTYVSADQCLFCVVYRIRSKRFKTVSSRRRHECRWHLSNISGTRPSRCPDVGCGEVIYGPIHWATTFAIAISIQIFDMLIVLPLIRV